jgi:signal peptidase I
MQPTTLLADPALRFTQARRPAPERTAGARRLAAPSRRMRPRVRISLGWLPLAVVITVLVGGLCFLRVWPPLATVMSASMAPTIDTGDMVLLKKLGRPAQIGDVVVVNVPDTARSRYGYPPVVIHRVVRIARDGTVTTKGDAKKEPDPFTVPRRVLTIKVVGHIPAGGQVFAFFSSTLGLLWLAGGVLLFFGMPLLDRQRDARIREEHDAATMHASLETITAEITALRSEKFEGRGDLERALADAKRQAAASQEQLRVVTTAFTEHLQSLPEQIERAVAAAVRGSVAPAPAPPTPIAPPARDVWVAPQPRPVRFTPTPNGTDLWPAQAHAILASPLVSAPTDLWPGQTPRFFAPKIERPPGPTPDLWPAQAPIAAHAPLSGPAIDAWPGQAPFLSRPALEPAPEFDAAPAPDLAPALEIETEFEIAPEPEFEAIPEPEPEFEAVLERGSEDETAPEDESEREPAAEPRPTPDLIPALRPSFGPPVAAPSVGPPGSPSWDSVPPALVRGRRRSGGLFGSADRYARRALASDAVRARLAVLPLGRLY